MESGGNHGVTLRSGVWAELKKAELSLVHQFAMRARSDGTVYTAFVNWPGLCAR